MTQINNKRHDRVMRFRSGASSIYGASSQRGVALAVSLVLLVSITILGVSTLSGTRLNERIASNTQQKTIAFEAAESAIASVSDYDVLIAALSGVADSGSDSASTNADSSETNTDAGDVSAGASAGNADQRESSSPYSTMTNDASGNGTTEAVTIDDAGTGLSTGYDLVQDGKGIDISGSVTVQYCGETQAIGNSLSAALDSPSNVAILVDINSKVSIANSGASADHLRRVSFLIPSTGRTGNCTVRN